MYNKLAVLSAVEKNDRQATAIEDIKKMLNTCVLAKCSNESNNLLFFSIYFNNSSTGNDSLKEWTSMDWFNMYTKTLSTGTFYKNLCLFIALYRSPSPDYLFSGLKNLIYNEISECKSPKRLINNIKTNLTNLQSSFTEVYNTVIPQVKYDKDVLKMKEFVNSILTNIIMDISLQLENIVNGSDSKTNKANLENGHSDIFIDENVIDKAKSVSTDIKKIEDAFDRKVLKAVNKIRDNRRKMKHAEMVGESLRISREIKRILTVLPIGLINPAIAAIIYIASIIYDDKTDVRDKAILIGDLKLEIKIIEQKIESAERKGNEKEKEMWIRQKDKLDRELERLQNNHPAY